MSKGSKNKKAQEVEDIKNASVVAFEFSDDSIADLTHNNTAGIVNLSNNNNPAFMSEKQAISDTPEPKADQGENLISSIQEARLFLESLVNKAETVRYSELKQSVGRLNKAAEKGEYIKFESRGQIKAIMLPIQKMEQLKKLEKILRVLALVEGKISVPEFLKHIEH